MKFYPPFLNGWLYPSPSVWRVWIEIHTFRRPNAFPKSPSVWRVWIEIVTAVPARYIFESPSVWRVWIEIV